jgi:nicotinamidase-related amidase
MKSQKELSRTANYLRALGVMLLVAQGDYALAAEWSLEDNRPVEEPKPYSPYVDQHFPERVLWGDAHHHTSLSVDSGLIGNTNSPDVSFRLARGEEVVSNTGQRLKLVRPLDFLVVTDHAEYLGIAKLLNEANPTLLATDIGKQWYAQMQGSPEDAWAAVVDMQNDFVSGVPKFDDPKVTRSVWEYVVDIASQYNQPGRFTALNGYEWSTVSSGKDGSGPAGANLHRVVIFRDGPDRVKQVLPFSAFDSGDPEKLWSNGQMYAEVIKGKKMSRDYAERRARWEPLMEVTQEKGDGETHPKLSPEDEFADFETWDFGDSMGNPKEDGMLEYEYARSTLKNGIRLEDKLGANPFKYGMIGSTDSHVSLTTTREENYFGKLPNEEPSPDRATQPFLKDKKTGETIVSTWQLGASGLVAVWARENTREAIFDAMARKEVYASSGTRMTVRIFGGWDFQPDEVLRPDFAAQGYARGVPMGGDLTTAPAGKAPSFMVRTLRDPDGANLDRIQIIKGWLDGRETQERVYDVACSDGRAIVNRRCEREVGSTVNVADASYTNSIGDVMLMAHWTDPDFDAKERAFYYVRVIEIPTPRWTAYDAKRFGITMPEEVTMTIQDRAYTSPIWYTP